MNHCCGLYIHIPFCQSKCPYCDFYSKACTPAESSLYTQKLCEIISLYAELYPNKIFDTLYIGGGTPSIIGTDNLVKIVTAAKQHFHTVSDMEITIEMNPCSAVKMDFDQLSAVNVNRISLGVQSANENELQLLGRIHRNADVIRTAEKIQKSKIENLSLDVMVGIAEQNETSLKNSLDFCIQNGAKHISAYLLKIEPNTPYQKLASRLNLPDDDKQADLYEFMVNYLTNKGYCQYEISNFAFSGFESRHNLKYWNCEEYLGLGASAHSLMDGKRFYFPRDIQSFYDNKTVSDGDGATEYEYIMLRLRLTDGISFEAYQQKFHRKFPERCLAKAEKYSRYQLISLQKNAVKLTQKGFLLSNVIIADILSEL